MIFKNNFHRREKMAGIRDTEIEAAIYFDITQKLEVQTNNFSLENNVNFFFSLKSPTPPLSYLGHSAHIPWSSSICFIHNMNIYSIQIQDGPVWSGLDN